MNADEGYLFSVMYGTTEWVGVIAVQHFYYYNVVKHFKTDSSICHVLVEKPSVNHCKLCSYVISFHAGNIIN